MLLEVEGPDDVYYLMYALGCLHYGRRVPQNVSLNYILVRVPIFKLDKSTASALCRE